MGYALTTKSQVTVPKAVRQALGVGPGQQIDYKVQKDGKVVMFPVKAHTKAQLVDGNPFSKWLGKGILNMSTEEIMRETRGDDCMR